MWCSECGELTACKAIPGAQVTGDAGDYAQRWYRTDHPDVRWFQRGRECLECGHEWLTAEVDVGRLGELIQLRDALLDLKRHADAYASESEAAEASLAALRGSLGALRALRIYREE